MHKPLLIPLALAAAATVLAAHTACSTSGTSYERGTLARPPSPARPGVGAPTYDPQVKPLPPQPQPKPARVLPQTPETRREPGIWASDAPGVEPALKLLGVPIAAPSVREQRLKTAWCASQADTVFREETYAKRDPTWLKCFANVLVQACLESERNNLKDRTAANTSAPYYAKRLTEVTPAAALAAEEAKRTCPSGRDAETTRAYDEMWDFISRTYWRAQ